MKFYMQRSFSVKIFPICPYSFGANTYLLISDREAFVVDPAVSVSAIEKILEREGAVLCGILLTHGHFDHTVSVDTIREKFPVPLMVHQKDACMLTNGKVNGFFDFYGKECVHNPADKTFIDGDRIKIGKEEIRVIHTPGHSQGSCCFLCHYDDDKEDKKEKENKDGIEKEFLVSGDTLFADSFGRCDLYGGDEAEMVSSLRKLRALDKSIRIFPGHGSDSTIGFALDNVAYYLDF